MVDFIAGPRWFFGIDSLFETISILVSFLIAIFVYRVYKLTGQKKYRNFSIAFLMISAGLSFKILSNFVVFYTKVEKSFYGLFTVTYIKNLDFINLMAFYFFRLLMVGAFIIILASVLRIKDRKMLGLLTIFAFIGIVLGNDTYFVFHLILALILGIITYYYYENYKLKKSNNSLLVMFAFLFIFLSQIIFIFLIFSDNLYAVGESLMLFGFLLLLTAYISILKK